MVLKCEYHVFNSSSVSIVTRLRARQKRNRGSITGRGKASRVAVEPLRLQLVPDTLSPERGDADFVNPPGLKAEHPPA
jgi:hypothetical protein